MQIEPLLRALADPSRLRIMRLLASMELAVGEIVQILAQSQPRVSRHVKILCDAGLAERHREGSWVFVRSRLPAGSGRTQDNLLATATERLLAAAERDDPTFAAQCATDRARLATIRDARAARAADYFAAHAAQWDQLRELLCDPAQVEEALLDALGGDLGSLLDVGTGTGRIAELLSGRADHVTALDKSHDMLALARARLQDLPPESVELVQGDFTALPFADGAFDTITLHQVLHYAQAPERVLAEAARVARPGGRIAIADLAPHGKEELRTVHAHARLGFGDDTMCQMLLDAGFEPAVTRTLDGGDLTIKVWTGMRSPLSASAGPATPPPVAIPSLSL
ncbi:ArsR family transcriptional regulator [Croceicoccus estronivorus]|uniref:ArsR/SmtB family transcription factor n=1 Tax=Croceicoccus estronivorus TaxID=1172626 RepID=UPI00082A8BE7|nr:metalloregulator ArsR/SmtB family transcription factor [Croceicoccus estronivorus]OCC23866.1 ArsR family transcriptional regulator [Croceicoccus estronivorus]